MRKVVRAGCVLAAGLTGCAAVPPLENPVLVKPGPDEVENPVLLAPGLPTPEGYAEVYERTLDVLDDFFPLKPGSRFSGQIETLPQVARGYEQPWKPGTPDRYETLLATFQTVRHYAVVKIWAGERGGFRVYVEVYKELEDLGRPAQALVSGAVFQDLPAQEQRADAVNTSESGRTWIPVGRDPAFEQAILRRIQLKCR